MPYEFKGYGEKLADRIRDDCRRLMAVGYTAGDAFDKVFYETATYVVPGDLLALVYAAGEIDAAWDAAHEAVEEWICDPLFVEEEQA